VHVRQLDIEDSDLSRILFKMIERGLCGACFLNVEACTPQGAHFQVSAGVIVVNDKD
jgi:hypothetical protein